MYDYGFIVWDEVVGMFVIFFFVFIIVFMLFIGFLLFCLFDILKFWLIGVVDKCLYGGIGIMLDDLFVGVMVCICLYLLMGFWLVIFVFFFS